MVDGFEGLEPTRIRDGKHCGSETIDLTISARGQNDSLKIVSGTHGADYHRWLPHLTMKKKTTWAASVVKKQLQTCCKHQSFSLDTTTERDDITSQAFTSPSSRPLQISSPIREAPTTVDPVLQRRSSFNVIHGRSLLSATPEPLTPFRKSVESAIPLCRSSTFKPQKLSREESISPELVTTAVKTKPVLHKSGPLPVLRELLRSGGGAVTTSPLNVKKQFSGPLLGRPPSPKQTGAGPSPQQRISKVKFSPLLYHESPTLNGNFLKASSPAKRTESPPTLGKVKVSSPLATPAKKCEEDVAVSTPPISQIVVAKVRKQTFSPVIDERAGAKVSGSPASFSRSPKLGERAHEGAVFREVHGEKCGSNLDHGEKREKGERAAGERDYVAAVVKIQAAYRAHQTRSMLALQRESGKEVSVEEAPSISTQMSRTDPQKQRRNTPPPRASRGWNGSIRSAQDHQALMRSRQEAAMKRERAMEYALSRQRWRTGSGSKPSKWVTDGGVPDKPGWVRNWLERASRMSAQHSQTRALQSHEEFDHPPQSESLSMKSTVGMCTTDIGSVEVHCNLGWPLSLRQQHAAGLLQSNKKTPIPEPLTPPTPPTIQITATPPPLQNRRRSKHITGPKFHDFSTSTADSGVVSRRTSDASPEIEESVLNGHDTCDQESVGSCGGPAIATTLTKVPSPVIVAPKSRMLQQQQQNHKLSNNSNSQKEAAKLLEEMQMQAFHPQSQVSVALSDGNSADTTAASIQRPLWR